jgi:hypothetical protein
MPAVEPPRQQQPMEAVPAVGAASQSKLVTQQPVGLCLLSYMIQRLVVMKHLVVSRD